MVNDNEVDQYVDKHEQLAVLAVQATDTGTAADVMARMNRIVNRAPDKAMLLALAIAYAEDRAVRGEAPGRLGLINRLQAAMGELGFATAMTPSAN